MALAGQAFTSFGELAGNGQLQQIASAVSQSGVVSEAGSFASQCKAAFDFVKFDIFTNFFQEIGLWFENLNFPEKFERAFRSIMSFVSLIWTFVMSITQLTMFYLWGSICVVLFTIWLIQKIFDPRIEVKGPNTFGWEQRGQCWLLWTRIIVTLLTWIYLPAMTSTFNVLLCSKTLMYEYEMQCYEGKHWGHMAAAGFVFCYIGIVFPAMVYRVINKYQPKPRMFDENGNEMDPKADEKEFLLMYRMLLARDVCPYRFLYNGYEYGRSAYRVVALVVKMLLVIPVTPLITSGMTQVSLSLVIVVIYAVSSTILRPFILEQDDWIDICARVTAVVTLVLQICVLSGKLDPNISSILLIVVNVVNLVVMILIFLGNMDLVKNFFRKYFGRLKFQAADLHYDMDRERKRRIWQRFWRGLFSTYGSLKPAYDRLVEMEDVAMEFGRVAYEKGLFPDGTDETRKREIEQARRLTRELEGVDVYYRPPLVTSDQRNFWGKMYIQPFPFRCVILYDDNDEELVLDDDQIIDFTEQNKQLDIILIRNIRKRLRCMDGETVCFECEDEAVIGSGRCGSGKKKRVKFEFGTLHVKTKTNDPFCQGFEVSIEYGDGFYLDSRGLPVQVTVNHSVGHDILGITEDWQLTEELKRLTGYDDNHTNIGVIQKNWDDVLERAKWFRDDLEEVRSEREHAASWAFWLLVFDNDYLPFEDLCDYLNRFEDSTELKTITRLYRDEFDALYSRLRYFDSHPAIALWYVFWDDVAVKNSVIKGIHDHPALFDLSSKDAIAYHPMAEKDLKKLLEAVGLRHRNGTGLFNNKILNKLYAALEAKGATTCDMSRVTYVRPPQDISCKDPRCSSTPLVTENIAFIGTAAINVIPM